MNFKKYMYTLFPNLDEIAATYTSATVVFCALPGKRHRTFKLDELAQAESWVAEQLAMSQNLYSCFTIQDCSVNQAASKARSNEAALVSPGVFIDLDFRDGTEAHKTQELPTAPEALTLLKGITHEPTLIIQTGHGYHAYYLFKQPLFLDDPGQREAVLQTAKGLQSELRARMKLQGWKLDATADPARLCRLPGTKNFKSDPALPVEMLLYEESRRYDLADLRIPKATDTKAPGGKEKESRTASNMAPSAEPIIAGCAFIEHVVADASSLPEPDWYAGISILARTKDGKALVHRVSAPYPGYTREATEQKIDHALKAAGPATCEHICTITGATPCGTCPMYGRIKSPIQLGDARWSAKKLLIIQSHDLADEANQAEFALTRCEEIFYRAQQLVRVQHDWISVPPGSETAPLVIDGLTNATVRELLSAQITFLRLNQKMELQPCYPPDPLIQALASRGEYPLLRHLRDITEVPVLRPDGTVLQTPGYDRVTQLLYRPQREFPPVPEAPTWAEVEMARDRLLDIVADFPFENASGPAVFLSGLLGPVARFAYLGTIPCFVIAANMPGAGKTKLVDTMSLITTGFPLPRMTQAGTEDEDRKRITTLLMNGRRQLLLDNVNARFGNGVIDALLTGEVWQDRVLGSNREVRLPNLMQIYVTGNNVQLQADTRRRCLHIRLMAKEEHPEERTNFKHPELEKWVLENHPRFLVDVLTILRGYWAAGRPPQAIRSLGSFGGWSSVVQSCVKWVCGVDPGESQMLPVGEQDADTEMLAELMDGWERLTTPGQSKTAREIIQLLGGNPEAGHGIQHALDCFRPNIRHTSTDLGNLLRKFKLRTHDGRYFEHAQEARTAHGQKWVLTGVAKK
jgi:hypothetical protein